MTTVRARRDRGDGGLRARAGNSWELKYPATDPATGLRKMRYATVKGTRADAQRKLRELIKEADDGAFVAPAKLTLGTFLDDWDKALGHADDKTLKVSPKTAERYRELVKLHIRPHLGELKLQMLRKTRIESFYNDLAAGHRPDGKGKGRALAPRTVHHVHRLMVKVLAAAVSDNLIQSNPARGAERPRIERVELEILTEPQAAELLTLLKGRSPYLLAALGLATGMRRGEMLALRWRDVDLDGAKLQVERSLEQTAAGLRFKSPKSKAGRRTIALPAFIVKELRAHKAAQAAQRLALGLGKDGPDALVLRRPDGSPMLPDQVSSEWRKMSVWSKLPKVSLHALRHTHASQLIASGMDVLTISRRLGHSNPTITLNIYGHLFAPTDTTAAAIVDKAFGGLNAE